MSAIRFIARASCLLSLISVLAGCVVAPAGPREGYYDRDHHRYYREEPREGYYDRDRHRYYREHRWHECHDEDDAYCR